MNGPDIAHALPHSLGVIQKHRAGNFPWLDLDGVEFHFQDDFYVGLSQLIIQAWRIKPNAVTRHFVLGWINKKLTYSKVRSNLTRLGWAYEEYANAIIVEGRAMFLFYYDEEDVNARQLCKIVVFNPQDAQNVMQPLTERAN